MIGFTELPQDGRLFEQFVREMPLILDLHPHWTGVGPDQGRDIIATEKLTGVPPCGTAENNRIIMVLLRQALEAVTGELLDAKASVACKKY